MTRLGTENLTCMDLYNRSSWPLGTVSYSIVMSRHQMGGCPFFASLFRCSVEWMRAAYRPIVRYKCRVKVSGLFLCMVTASLCSTHATTGGDLAPSDADWRLAPLAEPSYNAPSVRGGPCSDRGQSAGRPMLARIDGDLRQRIERTACK